MTSETVVPSSSPRSAAAARRAGSRRTESTAFAASPIGWSARSPTTATELAGLVATLGFVRRFLDHLLGDQFSALDVTVDALGHHSSSPNSSWLVLRRSAIAWITSSSPPASTTAGSRRFPAWSGPTTRYRGGSSPSSPKRERARRRVRCPRRRRGVGNSAPFDGSPHGIGVLRQYGSQRASGHHTLASCGGRRGHHAAIVGTGVRRRCGLIYDQRHNAWPGRMKFSAPTGSTGTPGPRHDEYHCRFPDLPHKLKAQTSVDRVCVTVEASRSGSTLTCPTV